MHIAPEHEFEPELGLPEPLPASERILWQGSPDWKSLALRAFHVRSLAVYFAVLLIVSGAFAAADGAGARDGLVTVLVLAPLAVFALVTLTVLAWLSARTSVYTVTDKRVVMRIGIVLSVTYNLPFARVGAAALGATDGGDADIALTLEGPDRIAYANLWPHARAWQVRHPQPMLRCIPDGTRVAALLARAWSESRGLPLLAGTVSVAASAVPASTVSPVSPVPARTATGSAPMAAARTLGFPYAVSETR